jgi:TolB protein
MSQTASDERLLTRSFMDQGPSWAPNGRLHHVRPRGPARRRARILTVDISGYNEREIATSTDASDPDWSPLIP